jgi:hypothetical protein
MLILPLDHSEPYFATLGVMLYPAVDDADPPKARAYVAQVLARAFSRFREAGGSPPYDVLAPVLMDAGEPLNDSTATRTTSPPQTLTFWRQNMPAIANHSLRDLVVEQVPICSLKPYGNNPRTHSKKQIRQLATSITTFGWTNPVLVDAANRIIAGHGRVEAAKLLGNPHVPVLRIEDLTEAQIKAYVIADNRLAELAGWDAEILANELQFLTELNLDFDIEVTGFEMGEIDVLIESQGAEHDPADDVPDVANARSPVTLLGDVWLLGPHRLACGNALSSESYSILMEGRRAQTVFTDPPYNISIEKVVSAHGKVKHDDFVMAVGELSSEEFTEFLTCALGHHAAYSQPGAKWGRLSPFLSNGASTALKRRGKSDRASKA